MKFLRTGKVKIDALTLPGDWKRRLDDPEVQELADSFDIVPLMQRPGIRKDREIIWGRDRLAACYLRGQRTVEVDIWECTDDELVLAEATENARRRRVDRDRAIADLVALITKQRQRAAREEAEETAASPMDSVEPWSPREAESGSRSKQPVPIEEPSKAEKAAARKEAAKLLGTTPAAVKQAEQRAKKAEEAPAPAPELPPGAGDAVAAALKEIDGLLVAAQKRLTRLTQDEPGLGERFSIAGAKSQISEAAGLLRGCAPAGECAYCKRVPSEQPNCQPCAGSGWLTKAQFVNVPPELRVTGDDAAIYVRGELVRVSVLREAAPSAERPPMRPVPKPGKRGQRAVVVAEDGSEREVEIPREEA